MMTQRIKEDENMQGTKKERNQGENSSTTQMNVDANENISKDENKHP